MRPPPMTQTGQHHAARAAIRSDGRHRGGQQDDRHRGLRAGAPGPGELQRALRRPEPQLVKAHRPPRDVLREHRQGREAHYHRQETRCPHPSSGRLPGLQQDRPRESRQPQSAPRKHRRPGAIDAGQKVGAGGPAHPVQGRHDEDDHRGDPAEPSQCRARCHAGAGPVHRLRLPERSMTTISCRSHTTRRHAYSPQPGPELSPIPQDQRLAAYRRNRRIAVADAGRSAGRRASAM